MVMKIGTKSVLFGAHCFLIHPWFVLAAWCKLYGFPLDPRIWIAFFVHDLGYLGKPNMDGPEGETHVLLGAKIMHLFDLWEKELYYMVTPTKQDHQMMRDKGYYRAWGDDILIVKYVRWNRSFYWHDFSMYHSRFYAKKNNAKPSKLCMADKLAVALEPSWLYLPRVRWTGEIREYMKNRGEGKYKGEPLTRNEAISVNSPIELFWFTAMTSYCKRWAYEHRDGRADTWTPEVRQTISQEGFYK